MSLLEPAPVSELSRREFWLNSATQLSGYGEYHAAKFSQGLDYNPLVTFARDPFGAGERFGPLPQQDLATSKEMGFDTDQPRLTEDQWKELGLSREGLAFSGGGTAEYERRRTEAFDKRRYNDSIIARYQGNPVDYVTGFGAQVLGGALSPENFIPFVGPAARAAMAARLGVIGGHAAVGAIDATIGTALADAAVLPTLRRQGEDVGAVDFAMDLALGAVAGTAFGAGGGWLERRSAAANAVRFTDVPKTADMLEHATAALEAGEPVNVGPIIRGADPGLVERLQRRVGEVLGVEHTLPDGATVEGLRGEAVGPETIRVYHGSPHQFERFSMEHIGTGEGAQAYGHGLYFAESAKVAAEYKNKLTDLRVSAAKRELAAAGGDPDLAIKTLNEEIGRLEALPDAGGNIARRDRQISIKREKIAELEAAKSGAGMSEGALYAVDLHVSRDELLDWDKPLSEQSAKVRAYFEDPEVQGLGITSDMTAGEAYQRIASLSSSQDVSGDLSRAGIRGIQYLDAGSRAGAEGTRNIVMFDDAAIKIREINGRPMDLTTTATPEAPHPSVVAAEKSYKVVPPDWTAEQATRIKEEGLDAPDDPHLAAVEQARQQGTLKAEQEAALATADAEAKALENEALAHEALATCTMRFG